MREIPQCWLTGQAAVEPRAVDVREVRRVLREQGAHPFDDAAVEAARGEPVAAE